MKVSPRGSWTWEVARLFPRQGEWTESEYLSLDCNRLMELADGCLLFPPAPDVPHQRIVSAVIARLTRYVESRCIPVYVLHAPLPVRLKPGLYREPDIVVFAPEQVGELDYPEGAILVMEVVGRDEDGRELDYQRKPLDYAAAGIPEFWIVDAVLEVITVFALNGDQYRVHGEFGRGDLAASAIYQGFEIGVSEVLDQASID